MKKTIRINYLAPGDVLKGRVEPIIWMRTCEWLTRQGYSVHFYSTYFYRASNVAKSDVHQHFATTAKFPITVLPTLISERFSSLLWKRLNYSLVFLTSITWLLIRYRRKQQVFFTKGQLCMRFVLMLQKLFPAKIVTVYELHSLGNDAKLVRMLKQMDLVIVNSAATKARVLSEGVREENLLTVYNAPFVKADCYSHEEARGKLNLPQQLSRLGYAGKLYNNNVEFFIELAKSLRDDPVHIDIVGGNPKILTVAQEHVSKLGLSNISFHGFIAPSQVSLYLSAADILFCSYGDEDLALLEQATPSKYFDYMNLERPFLCSRNTAIQELLIDGKHCLYFQPNNAEDLKVKYRQLATNPELQKSMVKRNNQLISSLSWEKRSSVIAARLDALTVNS